MDTETFLQESQKINILAIKRAKNKFLVYESIPSLSNLPPIIKYEGDKITVDVGKSHNKFSPMFPVSLSILELQMTDIQWTNHLKSLLREFEKFQEKDKFTRVCGWAFYEFFNGHEAPAYHEHARDVPPIVEHCHTSKMGHIALACEENKKELILHIRVQNGEYIIPHLKILTNYIHKDLRDRYNFTKHFKIEVC